MALFGNLPQPPLGQIQNPIEQTRLYDTAELTQNLPELKPGFFGKGGLGSKLLMGGIGGALDGIAVWGGAQPGYSTTMAEDREWQRELVKARLLEQMRAERPNRRAIGLPGAGIALVDENEGSVDMLREPAPPEAPDWQQKFNWYSSLPPDQRALVDQSGIMGGQTAYAYDRREQVKRTAPGKAPGAGGGGGRGGGGVTGNQRAKIVAEAEAAIAAGAPRDKVYARLRQMGVQ